MKDCCGVEHRKQFIITVYKNFDIGIQHFVPYRNDSWPEVRCCGHGKSDSSINSKVKIIVIFNDFKLGYFSSLYAEN